MNFIKSLFIFLSPLWLIFVLVYAVYGLLDNNEILYYLGVLLSTSPLLLFLSYIMLFRRTARTSRHLLVILLPSFSGYTVVLYSFFKNIDVRFIEGLIYSLSALFITFLYIYWYSDNARVLSKVIMENAQLPNFSLYDEKGDKVTSDELLGSKNLFIFYRGNWCPLCMAQVDEIVSHYNEFEKNSVHVMFVSPQPKSHTQKLAQKHDLKVSFYTDINNQTAKLFGIEHKFGLPLGFQALGYQSDSVLPTIIATNQNGQIIYSDQTSNYRLRPESKELLGIFQ